jgi:hypothetical protein
MQAVGKAEISQGRYVTYDANGNLRRMFLEQFGERHRNG